MPEHAPPGGDPGRRRPNRAGPRYFEGYRLGWGWGSSSRRSPRPSRPEHTPEREGRRRTAESSRAPPQDWVNGEPGGAVRGHRAPRAGETPSRRGGAARGALDRPGDPGLTPSPRPAASPATPISCVDESSSGTLVTEGATFLASRVSRFVVDLNRGEGDVDGEAVGGAGANPVATGPRVAPHHRQRPHAGRRRCPAG